MDKQERKTHYAGCEPATESDNNTYWSERTACGIEVDAHEALELSDREAHVDCKRCIKVLNKQNK